MKKGFMESSARKPLVEDNRVGKDEASEMKLGVAYNVFDGEELLLDSIRSIKSNVTYVAVVY